MTQCRALGFEEALGSIFSTCPATDNHVHCRATQLCKRVISNEHTAVMHDPAVLHDQDIALPMCSLYSYIRLHVEIPHLKEI